MGKNKLMTICIAFAIVFVSCERDEGHSVLSSNNNSNYSDHSGNDEPGGNNDINGPFDNNGASRAIFTVASGIQVHFSRGNLQYQASTGKWRFAEHQYDAIRNGNSNISQTNNDWIDLFGWGTSNWNSGARCYQPWATSDEYSDYYPGGSYINSLVGGYANADWGVNNTIENGGNNARMWRTLTKDEWNYLFKSRPNASSLYGAATVDGVSGIVILPDNWDETSDIHLSPGMNHYQNNSFSVSEWQMMEDFGAIFLPVTGKRGGRNITNGTTHGFYWSTTSKDEFNCYHLYFSGSFIYSDNYYYRYMGFAVRLVK